MKLLWHNQRANGRALTRRQGGMTLVEVMIATTLMVTIVIGGLLSVNYLGMQEDQLIESMAGANDTSREAVNTLLQDIRLAKGYNIGNYASATFTALTNEVRQVGNSVILYPVVNSTNQAVDTSQSIVYYFDTSDSVNNDARLWRSSSVAGSTEPATTIASNLINTLQFDSEDYTGNVQTNRSYKGVIHTTLQFCEFQYPLTKVGTNQIYQHYQIDCRATPHLPDGP